MEARFIDLPMQSRRAEVAANSVDIAKRTADMTWTTGAAVMREDRFSGVRYMERLDVDKKSVNLDRLNAGAPLLDSHRSYGLANIIGVVEPGTARIKDGMGIARVRFSERESVEPIFKDVASGVIRNVSVGYMVKRFEETMDKRSKMLTRTAVDWEPMELSLVPVPADAGAQIRATEEFYPVEIIERAIADEIDEDELKRRLAATERARLYARA